MDKQKKKFKHCKFIQNKNPVLSQRWPRDAPYIYWLFYPNFVYAYVHHFARIWSNNRKTSIKRRVSSRRRVSNKRRGLEATLEYQPYSYVI